MRAASAPTARQMAFTKIIVASNTTDCIRTLSSCTEIVKREKDATKKSNSNDDPELSVPAGPLPMSAYDAFLLWGELF